MIKERPLQEVRWGRCQAPLRRPYRLSFTELHTLDVVWVRLRDSDGRVGLGEAVALPGYGWETADEIAQTVAHLLEEASHLTANELRSRCLSLAKTHPFAVSAILTALELPDYLPALSVGFQVPLALPLAGDASENSLREQLLQGLTDGWRSFKIKIGRSFSQERANLEMLLTLPTEQIFTLSCDANQGYDRFQAQVLADSLARSNHYQRLLWFEQPLNQEDWDGVAELCRVTSVPILLDESIHDADDIIRAARIGVQGIKFKLCKCPGMAALLALIRLGRECGLRMVFGNGVASDIGALGEMAIISQAGHLLEAPFECNGVAKLERPLLSTGLWQVGIGTIRSLYDGDTLALLLEQEHKP
ncbi:MAG: hypothetical protein HQL55_17200 [Magnetococcales bacterium]|nr:hypothetical protein [Magnetococcales bacterium]